MKNNYLAPLLFTVSLALVISNYVGFQSFKNQKIFLKDLNSGSKSLSASEAVQMNFAYPNITITSIPIKSLVASYLINEQKFDLAKKMLYESIEDNPYLKVSESMLADIYMQEFNYDSAYVNSKKAFAKIPNNPRHFALYVKSCLSLKKYDELLESFEIVKNFGSEVYYEQMSAALYTLRDEREFLDYVIPFFEEAKKKFPENESIEFLAKKINIGEEKLKESIEFTEIAKKAFEEKKYELAAKYFEQAHYIDKENKSIFENYIVSEYESNQFKRALTLSDSFINHYQFQSEKIQILIGSSLYNLGEKDKACSHLREIQSKNRSARYFLNRHCR